MPIVKIADYVGLYRHLAASPDIHELSGRGNEKAATEFASARILEALEPASDDVLLDIGCGDGCLLRMAAGRVAQRIGVVPTVEEQSRLQTVLPDVAVFVGLAQALPFDPESASLIVCNSVLMLLESDDLVLAALQGIARVARPGARIWLGEIPAADELSGFGKYRGTSVPGYVLHDFRHKGARGLLSAGRALVAASIGTQTLVLCSAKVFYAEPPKFLDMAARCGLRVVRYFKHQRLDRSGKIAESPYRYNYLFIK